MAKKSWVLARMHTTVQYLLIKVVGCCLSDTSLPRNIYVAKKRLKEMARDGDSKVAKKARILAEASLGQKNSILRHMQTGATAAQRLPAKDIARE